MGGLITRIIPEQTYYFFSIKLINLQLFVRRFLIFFSRYKTDKELPVYVFQNGNRSAGLFSYFNSALSHAQHATKLGLPFVVDMQTLEYVNYVEADEVGKQNVWEIYFQQPDGLDLKASLASKLKVIKKYANPLYNSVDEKVFYDNNAKNFFRRLIQDRFPFSPALEIFLNDQLRDFFHEGKTYLGVAFRQGYVQTRPAGHFIQPELAVVIADCKRIMEEKSFDFIFLATDSSEIVSSFTQAFGDQLKYLRRPRVGGVNTVRRSLSEVHKEKFIENITSFSMPGDGTKYIETVEFDRSNDKYFKAREYLTEMVMLSRCQGFVASINSGTIAAYLLRPTDFDFEYVYKIGRY
jgi:hypothetical protein